MTRTVLRSDVSIEVAEHVLKRRTEQHPGPLAPYRVITYPGSFPRGTRVFIDSAGVRTDIRIRNGCMVIPNPIYKL